MFSERAPSSRALGDQVRKASKYRGYQLSVGHGSVDNVVRPTRADHIVRQCLDVETLPGHPAGDEQMIRIPAASGRTQTAKRKACSIAGMRSAYRLSQ